MDYSLLCKGKASSAWCLCHPFLSPFLSGRGMRSSCHCCSEGEGKVWGHSAPKVLGKLTMGHLGIGKRKERKGRAGNCLNTRNTMHQPHAQLSWGLPAELTSRQGAGSGGGRPCQCLPKCLPHLQGSRKEKIFHFLLLLLQNCPI